MEEWLAYLFTEAPDGPVLMVGPTIHDAERDIVRPLRELLGGACKFSRITLTGGIGPRRIIILLASDPRCGDKMRGCRFAGAWGTSHLRGYAAAILESRLLPGARCFG